MREGERERERERERKREREREGGGVGEVGRLRDRKGHERDGTWEHIGLC